MDPILQLRPGRRHTRFGLPGRESRQRQGRRERQNPEDQDPPEGVREGLGAASPAEQGR